MNITETSQGYELALVTDHSIDVTMDCNSSGSVEGIIEIGECEIERNSDNMQGIFICYDGAIISLNEMVLLAEGKFDTLLAEYEAEQRAEERAAQELSSPYMTGRV